MPEFCFLGWLVVSNFCHLLLVVVVKMMCHSNYFFNGWYKLWLKSMPVDPVLSLIFKFTVVKLVCEVLAMRDFFK